MQGGLPHALGTVAPGSVPNVMQGGLPHALGTVAPGSVPNVMQGGLPHPLSTVGPQALLRTSCKGADLIRWAPWPQALLRTSCKGAYLIRWAPWPQALLRTSCNLCSWATPTTPPEVILTAFVFLGCATPFCMFFVCFRNTEGGGCCRLICICREHKYSVTRLKLPDTRVAVSAMLARRQQKKRRPSRGMSLLVLCELRVILCPPPAVAVVDTLTSPRVILCCLM